MNYDLGKEVSRAKRRTSFDLTDKLLKLIQFFGGRVKICGQGCPSRSPPSLGNLLECLTAVNYRASFLIGVDGNDDVCLGDFTSILGRVEAAMRTYVEVRT